jgi:hypothetical protein
MEVHLDECSGSGQVSERNAFHLADQWLALVTKDTNRNGEIIKEGLEEDEESGRKVYKFLNRRSLAKLLHNGLLGAIVVKKEQKAIEIKNKIVGMAFFHRKSYSTWQGRVSLKIFIKCWNLFIIFLQFPVLDNIFVADSARQKGVGTAIMAELVKVLFFIFLKKLIFIHIL